MLPIRHTLRGLALLLIVALTLPNPVFALRTEAVAERRPDALAALTTPSTPQSPVGLEETKSSLLIDSAQEGTTRYTILVPPSGYAPSARDVAFLLLRQTEGDNSHAWLSLWRGRTVQKIHRVHNPREFQRVFQTFVTEIMGIPTVPVQELNQMREAVRNTGVLAAYERDLRTARVAMVPSETVLREALDLAIRQVHLYELFSNGDAEAPVVGSGGLEEQSPFTLDQVQILIVEDDDLPRRLLVDLVTETLAKDPRTRSITADQIHAVDSVGKARPWLQEHTPPFVITDWSVIGGTGDEVARMAKEVNPAAVVILETSMRPNDPRRLSAARGGLFTQIMQKDEIVSGIPAAVQRHILDRLAPVGLEEVPLDERLTGQYRYDWRLDEIRRLRLGDDRLEKFQRLYGNREDNPRPGDIPSQPAEGDPDALADWRAEHNLSPEALRARISRVQQMHPPDPGRVVMLGPQLATYRQFIQDHPESDFIWLGVNEYETPSHSFKYRQFIDAFFTDILDLTQKGRVKPEYARGAAMFSSGNAILGALETVAWLKTQGWLPQEFQITLIAMQELAENKLEKIQGYQARGHLDQVIYVDKDIAAEYQQARRAGPVAGPFTSISVDANGLPNALEDINQVLLLVDWWAQKEQKYHLQASNSISAVVGGASLYEDVRLALTDRQRLEELFDGQIPADLEPFVEASKNPLDYLAMTFGGAIPVVGQALAAMVHGDHTQILGVRSTIPTESIADSVRINMALPIGREGLRFFGSKRLRLVEAPELAWIKAVVECHRADIRVEPTAIGPAALLFTIMANDPEFFERFHKAHGRPLVIATVLSGENYDQKAIQSAETLYQEFALDQLDALRFPAAGLEEKGSRHRGRASSKAPAATKLPWEPLGPNGMVGKSQTMVELFRRVETLRSDPANDSVLILGARGSGKSRLAEAFGPFRRINAGILSSLSGDALDARVLSIVRSLGSENLIIDDLQRASKDVQSHLFQLLENRSVPDEEGRDVRFTSRIIATASTLKGMDPAVQRRFDAVLHMPPLGMGNAWNRKGDAALLAEYFNWHFSRQSGIPWAPLDRHLGSVMEEVYHWSAEVSGIENTMRAMIQTRKELLQAKPNPREKARYADWATYRDEWSPQLVTIADVAMANALATSMEGQEIDNVLETALGPAAKISGELDKLRKSHKPYFQELKPLVGLEETLAPQTISQDEFMHIVHGEFPALEADILRWELYWSTHPLIDSQITFTDPPERRYVSALIALAAAQDRGWLEELHALLRSPLQVHGVVDGSFMEMAYQALERGYTRARRDAIVQQAEIIQQGLSFGGRPLEIRWQWWAEPYTASATLEGREVRLNLGSTLLTSADDMEGALCSIVAHEVTEIFLHRQDRGGIPEFSVGEDYRGYRRREIQIDAAATQAVADREAKVRADALLLHRGFEGLSSAVRGGWITDEARRATALIELSSIEAHARAAGSLEGLSDEVRAAMQAIIVQVRGEDGAPGMLDTVLAGGDGAARAQYEQEVGEFSRLYHQVKLRRVPVEPPRSSGLWVPGRSGLEEAEVTAREMLTADGAAARLATQEFLVEETEPGHQRFLIPAEPPEERPREIGQRLALYAHPTIRVAGMGMTALPTTAELTQRVLVTFTRLQADSGGRIDGILLDATQAAAQPAAWLPQVVIDSHVPVLVLQATPQMLPSELIRLLSLAQSLYEQLHLPPILVVQSVTPVELDGTRYLLVQA